MEEEYIVIALIIILVVALFWRHTRKIEGFETENVTANKPISEDIVI